MTKEAISRPIQNIYNKTQAHLTMQVQTLLDAALAQLKRDLEVEGAEIMALVKEKSPIEEEKEES